MRHESGSNAYRGRGTLGESSPRAAEETSKAIPWSAFASCSPISNPVNPKIAIVGGRWDLELGIFVRIWIGDAVCQPTTQSQRLTRDVSNAGRDSLGNAPVAIPGSTRAPEFLPTPYCYSGYSLRPPDLFSAALPLESIDYRWETQTILDASLSFARKPWVTAGGMVTVSRQSVPTIWNVIPVS